MKEETNKVNVVGRVASALQFNHEVYGEEFYTFTLEVSRLSENTDKLQVMISGRMINAAQDYTGKMVAITGQLRSSNREDGDKRRLELSIFAQEYIWIDACGDNQESNNMVYLDGFICKEPAYRKTPMGREITDLMLAVNRPYGKSDYIPCICWGRNARYVAQMPIGSRIQVRGRFQSREYIKRITENEYEKRVAYELSANWIDVAAEEAG